MHVILQLDNVYSVVVVRDFLLQIQMGTVLLVPFIPKPSFPFFLSFLTGSYSIAHHVIDTVELHHGHQSLFLQAHQLTLYLPHICIASPLYSHTHYLNQCQFGCNHRNLLNSKWLAIACLDKIFMLCQLYFSLCKGKERVSSYYSPY